MITRAHLRRRWWSPSLKRWAAAVHASYDFVESERFNAANLRTVQALTVTAWESDPCWWYCEWVPLCDGIRICQNCGDFWVHNESD